MIRTVKNGRVKINHKYYSPNGTYCRYDGRLEGMKLYFGTYMFEDRFVAMIDPVDGSETHIVNGYLPWCFWYLEEAK